MKRYLLSLVFLIATTLSASSLFAYSYTFQCNGGGGPAWAQVPVNYWINQNGSDDIPFNQLTDIMADSFATWGEPCCSEFSALYQGTTQLTAENNSGRIVLSWTESNWPTMYGSVNSTIGVTLLQAFNNCTLAQAPIVYNGQGFTFRTNGQSTDMQSISTHEIGHLLGLGHSDTQEATMFASYIGGTGARTIHQDDENGVCSLYTISCNCQSNAECKTGEECVNARCVEIPCTSDNQCSNGEVCNTQSGDCEVPRCASDNDCATGFQCSSSGVCQSECAACRTCTSDTDCTGGGTCADIGNGARCLFICEGGVTCEGDSQCITWQFEGQNGPQQIPICSAPGDPELPCPNDYVCKADDTPVDECQTDNDCPADEECVSSGGQKVCRDAEDPCEGVQCGDNETCQNGTCVDNGGNNNTNNNNGNNNSTSGSTSSGNNGSGSNNDVVIIIDEEPTIVIEDGGTNETCSAAPSGRPGILFLLGFFVILRRRTKKK